MARTLEENIAHLLRRAGFGGTPEEIAAYAALGYAGAVDQLVNYEQVPDVADTWIGIPGYAPVLAANQMAGYLPNYVLNHARARWLFRMVYSPRPLVEKMALFWHNHFATGYSKIAGETRPSEATRLMAAVPAEDPARQLGQIELFRAMPLGSFYDLLLAVTRDPAMLYWLDGRRNVKAVPQENYGREVMELFTMGVTDALGDPNYTEEDVKAAARVFTGWNLRATRAGTIRIRDNNQPLSQYSFFYDARQHDTDAKVFSFPIYPDGRKVIPPRTATLGVQDGLDFLTALVHHPSTATRLATKLYRFFVNDIAPPSTAVNTIAGWLQSSGFNLRMVMSQLFMSEFFLSDESFYARYRWPIEHVVGTLRALGPGATPLVNHVAALTQMNELLLDPPSVEGYKGAETWFNSNTMLARANFASTHAASRREDLVALVTAAGIQRNPAAIVDFFLTRMGIYQPDGTVRAELIQYLTTGTGANWSGSTAQLRTKVPGLIHLISGTADYAFV